MSTVCNRHASKTRAAATVLAPAIDVLAPAIDMLAINGGAPAPTHRRPDHAGRAEARIRAMEALIVALLALRDRVRQGTLPMPT